MYTAKYIATATVEPRLFNPHISVPSLIWKDVQKFLNK